MAVVAMDAPHRQAVRVGCRFWVVEPRPGGSTSGGLPAAPLRDGEWARAIAVDDHAAAITVVFTTRHEDRVHASPVITATAPQPPRSLLDARIGICDWAVSARTAAGHDAVLEPEFSAGEGVTYHADASVQVVALVSGEQPVNAGKGHRTKRDGDMYRARVLSLWDGGWAVATNQPYHLLAAAVLRTTDGAVVMEWWRDLGRFQPVAGSRDPWVATALLARNCFAH